VHMSSFAFCSICFPESCSFVYVFVPGVFIVTKLLFGFGVNQIVFLVFEVFFHHILPRMTCPKCKSCEHTVQVRSILAINYLITTCSNFSMCALYFNTHALTSSWRHVWCMRSLGGQMGCDVWHHCRGRFGSLDVPIGAWAALLSLGRNRSDSMHTTVKSSTTCQKPSRY
jgi:hypothetical protein